MQFGVQELGSPFVESWAAPLDGEGRFRIELRDEETYAGSLGARGPLRYLVLALDYTPLAGELEAGDDPLTLDVLLSPQSWRETELMFRDEHGQPVEGVVIGLSVGGSPNWDRLRADAEGRCIVTTPSDFIFGVVAQREGFRHSTFAFRRLADAQSQVIVPMRPPVQGRVVGENGEPAAGISIGGSIYVEMRDDEPQCALSPIAGSPVTDEDGRFVLNPALRLDPRSMSESGELQPPTWVVCFAEADFGRMAFLYVNQGEPEPSYEITMRPTRRVRVPISHVVASRSGGLRVDWELRVRFGPENRYSSSAMRGVASTAAEDGANTIEALWPVDTYRLELTSADPAAGMWVEQILVDIEIPSGDGPVDLPAVRMEPLAQSRLVGQPAPEIDARDLSTGEPVRLADLRGKVVILDFWGYWCGPCVGAMPELVAIHDEFRDQPVEIVALHDQSVQSREAYDLKLAGTKRDVWEGRDLPFRVALDRPDPELPDDANPIGEGLTCKQYGVLMFPTTYLIDQGGNVVGMVNAGDRERLIARIRELLAKE